jgi:magnesium transporter
LSPIANTMKTATLVARGDETVGSLCGRLRGHPHLARAELLCVTDSDEHLLGTLPTQLLLALPEGQPLAQVARAGLTVRPEDDPEHVASLTLHHRHTAVPVTDAEGRLVGMVGASALLHILRSEHISDLHRLAGMSRETEQARHAIEAPPLRRARHRLPWLVVGLVGSMLATFIVARFEDALARVPAIAFFVPGLVYLADAIGTQSEAVAVRVLSLARVGIGQLIGDELRTGALIGLALAALTVPAVWLAFSDAPLALAVGVALAASCAVATVLGLLLPWLLGRLGQDPAYGSGPLATIVQDLLSLLIYFAVMSWLVLR